MIDVPWEDIWRDLARRLAAHRSAGRAHLLTEDTVRMEAIHALGRAGVPPSRLTVEVRAPELGGGSIDLVVDLPAGVVIEFKYPRGSRTGVNPDTMTLGELVRDFLRVAAVPAVGRWVVQVLDDRLVRYLLGVRERYAVRWVVTPGDVLELVPAGLARLPPTAVTAIGNALPAYPVRARCAVAVRIGDDLALYAFDVAAPAKNSAQLSPSGAPTSVALSAPAVARSLGRPRTAESTAATRDGARREILASARRVTTRTGRETFRVIEIIEDMRAHRTGYADSTIRTMLGSHLRADVDGVGVAGYSDVERVAHGEYRLRVDPG